MKTKYFSFLLLLPFLLATRQELVAQIGEKALLWEIKGPKQRKPSYLYGTIHVQSSKVFAYDKVVEDKIKQCDGFAMELVLDEINQLEMLQEMTLQGTTLDKLLTKAEFELVDKYLQAKTGLSLKTFNNVKPFLVYSQLLQGDMAKEEEQLLDMHLLKIARAAKKKIDGVEQLKEQMGAIASISLQDQAKMLVKLAQDTASSDSQFDELVLMYLDQDLDKMIAMSNDPSLPAEFSQNFLVLRNIKMAEKIKSLTKERTTFTAIGAAHLGGKDGVLALLKSAGYEIKPIAFSFKN